VHFYICHLELIFDEFDELLFTLIMKTSNFIYRTTLVSAVFLSALGSSAHAQMPQRPYSANTQPGAASEPTAHISAAGSQAGKVFGPTYAPVGVVSPQQVQVVYFRAPMSGANARSAANVYVDGEFQSALKPNGYTVFCVNPGEHTLGAYLHDAPLYKGKTTDRFSANLKGGNTYFLKVQENGSGMPVAVAQADAERELAGTREQAHALSRASTVVACQTTPLPAAAPQPQYKDYALKGDMLFAFGKSGYRDMTGRGREEVGRLVAQIREENTSMGKILVIGHADQIGSDEAAEKLGLQRAQTVRRVLIERGIRASEIEASSAGNTEPVVESCHGNRQQVIACYAPNRRVVVRVEMRRPA
jgi:OmpA-OmpF porin, OOP family